MISRSKHLAQRVVRLIIATGIVIYKRLPYIALASISLYFVILIGIHGYYRFMPAEWFINIQSAKIDNSYVGEELIMTLCRTTRSDNIKQTATRTFYLASGEKKYTAAGDYEFEATIENAERCQAVPIAVSKHPNKPGTYYAHTEAEFYVNGFKKVLKYDTDQFVISATTQSIELQIENLQRQIDELRRQLSLTSPVSSSTETGSSQVSVNQTNSQQEIRPANLQSNSNTNNTSTSDDNTDEVPAIPDTDEPAPTRPIENFVRGIIDILL